MRQKLKKKVFKIQNVSSDNTNLSIELSILIFDATQICHFCRKKRALKGDKTRENTNLIGVCLQNITRIKPTPTSFQFLTLNCQLVGEKELLLNDLVFDYKPDIVFFTETFRKRR